MSEERRRPALGSVRARLGTLLAAVLVVLSLVVPSVIGSPTASMVWSVPLEALLAAVILLIVPSRVRRVSAVVLGVLLGLSTVLRLVDLGFFAALARPFDLLLDWTLFGNGFEFLTGAFGLPGAVVALVAAVVVAVSLLLALTWSVVRLSRLAESHRVAGTRLLVVGAAVLLAYQLAATQILTSLPPTAAAVAYARALTVQESWQDQQAFAAELEVDAFANVPGADLLTGLRRQGRRPRLRRELRPGRRGGSAARRADHETPHRRESSPLFRRLRRPQRLPDLVDVRRR